MTWFFNIKETKKLYREFIIKNGEVIYKGIIQGLVKDEKKSDFEKFIKDLQVYLYDLPKIFLHKQYIFMLLLIHFVFISDNKSLFNYLVYICIFLPNP